MNRTLTMIGAALALTIASEAHAIDHSQDANWAATVNRVAAISAQQHHGKPLTEHVDNPQVEMSSSNLIWYWDTQGRTSLIAVRRNDDGEILQRQVCKFDVSTRRAEGAMWRYCTDFDTTVKSVEHKNPDGTWHVEANDQADDDGGAGL